MNKFDIKDRIDHAIYGTYNILADVNYFFSREAKKIIRKNAHFKGIHEGKRCFILGTGPSLLKLGDGQLAKLRSEISFGVNSLYKSDPGSKLTPYYYTLIDNEYWGSLSFTFGEVLEKYNDAPPVFITDVRAKKILDDFSLDRNIYIYSKKYPTRTVDDNLTKNIYGLMNSVSYCIVVAMYMGFREIYLLGCDYNAFCNAGRGHCYDDEQEVSAFNCNLSYYLKYYNITTEFHYLIAKLARAKGVAITNLTESSLLDAYPRKPTSSIL